MPNHDRRSFRSVSAIAAVAALLLLGAASPARAATDAQCSTAWNESSASDTCTSSSIYAEGDNCVIYYSCTKSNGNSGGSQSITSALNSVSGLRNCNGLLWWTC